MHRSMRLPVHTLYDERSHLVNMTVGLKSGERREPRSSAVRRYTLIMKN
jgi:hypothetical protein